jgi:F-type H+-transporting ATPase subunit b
MAEPVKTTEGTEVPANANAGFPPFDTTTFPSQLFWLAITFGFLFVVLWRVAGPRINATITTRRVTINDAIAQANQARQDAQAAQAGYEAALAGARSNANALADETRRSLNAEIAHAKAQADAEALKAMHDANLQITHMRDAAASRVAEAARDAVVAIVERLTGDTVSAQDAATAIEA